MAVHGMMVKRDYAEERYIKQVQATEFKFVLDSRTFLHIYVSDRLWF